MTVPTTTDLVYLAGVFDGAARVSVKLTPRGSVIVQIRLHAPLTVLVEFANRLGIPRLFGRRPKRGTTWTLSLAARSQVYVLAAIRAHSKQPRMIDEILAIRNRIATYKLSPQERLAIMAAWRAKKEVDLEGTPA